MTSVMDEVRRDAETIRERAMCELAEVGENIEADAPLPEDRPEEGALPSLDYLAGWLAAKGGSVLGLAEQRQLCVWLRRLAVEVGHLRTVMSERPVMPIVGPNEVPLTITETKIFRYLRNTAMSQVEIANTMFVSINTVKTHAKNIYRKLGVGRRAGLRALSDR